MDDLYSQLFLIAGGIPEPDLDGVIKKRDDDLYDLYKERNNPFVEDPLAPPIELAAGKSPFSTPYWDKQNQIDKYLENIRRLKERGLLGGIPKA
jgi:hypothetical protein|tara:strand:+ start:417 stop:698 length:282 start_codon:yes stop_codon:yes gene_type:complete